MEGASASDRAGLPQGLAEPHDAALRRVRGHAGRGGRGGGSHGGGARHGGEVLLAVARHHRPRRVQLRLRLRQRGVAGHQGRLPRAAGGGAPVELLHSLLEGEGRRAMVVRGAGRCICRVTRGAGGRARRRGGWYQCSCALHGFLCSSDFRSLAARCLSWRTGS